MSTESIPDTVEVASEPRKGWGEWAIAAALVVMGGIVLWDGLHQPASTSASGIGAGAAPIVVGSALLVLAAVLCVQLARGRHGEPEIAEGDVDLSVTKWMPLAVTIAALLFFIFTLELIGYIPAATGTFWLVAWAMGSRRYWVNLLIGFVLTSVIFFSFTKLLEISLPAGPLEGII